MHRIDRTITKWWKMEKPESLLGLRPLGPQQGPSLDPSKVFSGPAGGLQRPSDPSQTWPHHLQNGFYCPATLHCIPCTLSMVVQIIYTEWSVTPNPSGTKGFDTHNKHQRGRRVEKDPPVSQELQMLQI